MKLKTIVLITFVLVAGAAYGNSSNEELLNTLDSLLLNRHILEERRKYVADNYKHRLINAQSDEERYRVNNMLYDFYSRYSVDSAMNYLDRNFVIANEIGDKDRIADLKIKKSFLFAASGLLMESAKEMMGMNGGVLQPETRRAYYGEMAYLYDHLATYHRIMPDGDSEYFGISNAYKDSLMSIMQEDHREYLWYLGWVNLGASKEVRDSVIEELKKVVDNSSLQTPDDAKNAYILGCHYQKNADKENSLHYLVKAAIADVKMCNRDIASLQRLAILCLERGDVERANSYIDYCMEAALKYPNRVRASTIAPIQHRISIAYQEKQRLQQRTRKTLLILISVLSVCLAIAMFFIIREFRQLKHKEERLDMANLMLNQRIQELSDTKSQLSEVNSKLSSINQQLKEANAQLNESNYVKEEYVGYVFSLCSQYIKFIDDFRRTINRKAKVNQWEDIKAMTEGKKLEHEALKEFYTNFDSIFLHLYPHFISDFNALLQSDQQILPKEGEMLSTELRIYALIRLGITDSVKIADFLHCSPQTVYNYRFRTRNKALVPKEEFIKAVKTLGQVVIE